jgi:hypothetical protein
MTESRRMNPNESDLTPRASTGKQSQDDNLIIKSRQPNNDQEAEEADFNESIIMIDENQLVEYQEMVEELGSFPVCMFHATPYIRFLLFFWRTGKMFPTSVLPLFLRTSTFCSGVWTPPKTQLFFLIGHYATIITYEILVL